MTLETAFDRFLSDPARSRTVKTASHYENLRSITSGLWGPEKPLTTVGRDDCRRLLETLRVLPPNTSKRFAHLPITAVVDLAKKGRAGGAMSPATVNGYMAKFRAALNFAVNEGWIDRNPARGLRVIDPVRARDKRQPFSPSQLRLIFDAPLYRGCADDQDGYAVSGPMRPRRARFWIPLLALFAGLRLNEACQLEVDDVRSFDGVPCIAVTSRSANGPSKRLKTAASERVVPVHPMLIDLSFLDFVAEVRAQRRVRLFDELATGSSGYVSDPFSKWFRRFLARAGAAEPRTCFHSFRHTFRDALRDSAVPHEVALALGGWASGDSNEPEAAYGRGFSPSVLRDAIARIAYSVDLSHLVKGADTQSEGQHLVAVRIPLGKARRGPPRK